MPYNSAALVRAEIGLCGFDEKTSGLLIQKTLILRFIILDLSYPIVAKLGKQ